ncbi:MAG: hypothetical protein U0U67_01865 [Chitinophagales bacterium]
MKKLYNILFFLFLSVSFYSNGFSEDKITAKSTIRSIWKYEQDQSKFSPEDGIAKKIFFLSLNDDGTFHQYVKVIPLSPKDYFRVKNYELDGTWREKDGKIILEEYGKINEIDYTYFITNFENIDNQVITKK